MALPIFDTHQHLLYPDRLTYSWTASIPALDGQSFTHEQYLKASEGTGIAGSLFMETSPDSWQEELPVITAVADRSDRSIRGMIANCRPEDSQGFAAYIDSIHSPRLLGLRRICHVEPDALTEGASFVTSLRYLGTLSLSFDLCFLARQLPLAATLASRCGNTQFILDHCGVPDITGCNFDSWSRALREVASLPNVCCKLSGLPAYCAPGKADIETIRPYFEYALEQFGWDRVVWGSDWPVCNQRTTLAQWVGISRELVKQESLENQRKLFYENAARIYRIPA